MIHPIRPPPSIDTFRFEPYGLISSVFPQSPPEKTLQRLQNIVNKTLGVELRPMGTGNSHEPDQDPEIKFMERAGPSHDPELDPEIDSEELERMVKELKMAIEEPIWPEKCSPGTGISREPHQDLEINIEEVGKLIADLSLVKDEVTTTLTEHIEKIQVELDRSLIGGVEEGMVEEIKERRGKKKGGKRGRKKLKGKRERTDLHLFRCGGPYVQR